MATKRKRKKLSNATRFEVFKRDSFTCQYCGRKAPEIVLELDHIEPISNGGVDEILNLITSCWACNNGKSDRRLDDGTVIAKQHAQLAELQERREQLDMLLRWRDANVNMADAEDTAFVGQFYKAVPGWTLNDAGRRDVRRMLSQFGLARCLEALDRAVAHKVIITDGKATAESVDSLLGLVFVMAQPDEHQRLYKIRAKIRFRWNYVIDGKCIRLLKQLLERGVSIGQIETTCQEMMAEKNTSFTWWCIQIEQWISDTMAGRDV